MSPQDIGPPDSEAVGPLALEVVWLVRALGACLHNPARTPPTCNMSLGPPTPRQCAPITDAGATKSRLKGASRWQTTAGIGADSVAYSGPPAGGKRAGPAHEGASAGSQHAEAALTYYCSHRLTMALQRGEPSRKSQRSPGTYRKAVIASNLQQLVPGHGRSCRSLLDKDIDWGGESIPSLGYNDSPD